MRKILTPDEWHESIYDIDLSGLYSQGYRNILLDVDNTITHWNSNEVTDKLRQWIQKCHEIGFFLCLFSNNNPTRVGAISQSLKIPAAPKGGKPFAYAFKRALLYIEGDPENTLMVGDQVFTDILGANRIGLYTILIDPLSNKEFWGTRFNRFLERILIGRR